VRGVVIIGRDVTERVSAEEEMRRLNEELERRIADRAGQLSALVKELRENERSLRESEERFRRTFEGAEVSITHVGLDSRWLRVNGKLCDTLGYTYEELQKLAFQDIMYPDDLEADLDQVRRLLSREIEEYSIAKRYKKVDGGYLWGSLSVSLVRKESGEPSYFISVIEDIDERKRAELAVGTLTPREKEVLLLLARSRRNAQIAESATH
jgi:two-component system sensor histidine kinase UhpB